MIKILLGVGVVVALVLLARKLKAGQVAQATVGDGSPILVTSSPDGIDESGGVGTPAVDNPGGTFLGNKSDTRSPINVVVGPGSTRIMPNPVLEWTANTGSVRPIGRQISVY